MSANKQDPRTSIQIAQDVLDEADLRWRALGYASRNQYMVALVEIDLRLRPDHVIVRSEKSGGVVPGDRVIQGASKLVAPSKPAHSNTKSA